MMGKYVYESHMGGLYTSEYPLPFDYLYCEQCGDSDWELGYFESRAKVRKMMKEKGYTNKYIKEFLDENFPKDGDGNG